MNLLEEYPLPWALDENLEKTSFSIFDASGNTVMWQDNVSADNAGVYLTNEQARELVEIVNLSGKQKNE